jgi:hypothetical protein
MPNPEAPLPFRTCIHLEDSSQAGRTSSIDAEWDALSVASTQPCALQALSARPRLDTLPGIGPAGRLASQAHELERMTTLGAGRPASATSLRSTQSEAPKPRRSLRSRLLVSTLAATLSSGLALVAVVVWDSDTGLSASRALALGVQSNLAAAISAPYPSPMSDPSQTPISALAPPLPPALVSAPEATEIASTAEPAKPARRYKPLRKAKVGRTDNPY